MLLEIDHRPVVDTRDVARIVTPLSEGKVVELVFLRDGKQQRIAAKLGVNPEDAKPSYRELPPAEGSVLPQGMLRGAALQVTLLFLAALLMTLASREITRPEWDLEWLVTLPLPLSTLLASRLLERVMTNAASLFMLTPFLMVLAFECGHLWSAPFIALGLTIALAFVVATLQSFVDTGLRLSMSPPKLRNLHALISVTSVIPLLLAMSTAVRDKSFVFGWVPALPDWMDALPTGLAVKALAATNVGSAMVYIAIMLGEVVAVTLIGYVLLLRQLRNGVVMGGAREAVARAPAAKRMPSAARSASESRPEKAALLPPVQRRELRLLGRDRSFMSQTLLLPPLVVGTQIFLNMNGGNIFAGAVEHPANLAAIAFALASYTLMLSAFQALNAEGQALWILYCVPQSLESVLWQKAKLWAVAACFYPLVLFVVAAVLAGSITLEFLGLAAIVLIGVPIFAVVATALGVRGCDPLAQEVQRRLRPTYTYLYLTLASLYTYSLYASTLAQRVALMVLTALLAAALWQKARDQFDYLLDPSAAPPTRVSVSDGLIAALIFFVAQGLVLIFFQVMKVGVAPAAGIWLAFCLAGAVTYVVMRLVYWRTRAAGVPRLLGPDVPRALLLGLAGGLVASCFGIAYLRIAASTNLLPPTQLAERNVMLWLGSLAILAAPVFEEFIFRGLIFGGLRRTLRPSFAMLASAAIFAIVHPPLSMIPVFFLGVSAAFVYDRTKMLAAPMLVHALYNAAILGFQWTMMT
jgi:membrane protease YdiL (CAAX protease family)